MRTLLPIGSALMVVLAASSTLADPRDKLSVRAVMLSEHPDDATHRVYVKGQVVTVLRFEQSVDASRTKMIGWEGRLEPLAVVRNKVVLEPIHDLDEDEALPLVVALADGTQASFLLRPPGRQEGASADQQVDVFKDPESYAALHASLMRALKREKSMEGELERYRQEETSEDSALAALLASGGVAQTPFKVASRAAGTDNGTEIHATVFKGKGKAAVVFNVKNLDPARPWSMKSARLVAISSGRESAVAVHTTRSSIGPGEAGVVAAVADRSAFIEGGKMVSVFLELYRHDGLRQAFVQLDPDLVAR